MHPQPHPDPHFNPEPHEESERCSRYHCSIHNTDEPESGYELCMECGHCFATAQDLEEADLAVQTNALQRGFTTRQPQRAKARDIHTCPHCAHSF